MIDRDTTKRRKDTVGSEFKENTVVFYNQEKQTFTLMCRCGNTALISCARWEGQPTTMCKKCSAKVRGANFIQGGNDVKSRDNTGYEDMMIEDWLAKNDVSAVVAK